MGTGKSTERRRHQRFPLATSVEFYHPPSKRDFPARCSDISAGGMLMYVPAATPLQPGHAIRLNLRSLPIPQARPAGYDGKPMDAIIVRVDRQPLLEAGHLAVGVKFASA